MSVREQADEDAQAVMMWVEAGAPARARVTFDEIATDGLDRVAALTLRLAELLHTQELAS